MLTKRYARAVTNWADASYNHPRFGTPVVYLRTEDKLVNLKSLVEPKQPARTETGAATHRTPIANLAVPASAAAAPLPEKNLNPPRNSNAPPD